jgi:hypothetical protein
VYCAGSVLQLLSASSVSAVCQDSKVFRFLWFPLSITLAVGQSQLDDLESMRVLRHSTPSCFVSHSLRVRTFSSSGIFLFHLCSSNFNLDTVSGRPRSSVLLLVVSVLQMGIGVRGFSLAID